MSSLNKKEPFLLLLGDVVSFYIALWLMLLLRYGKPPTHELLASHVPPFTILFLVWILVFYVAGLYEKHTLILKTRISGAILNVQIINSVLAIVFFYLIPYFGITPKTNLFIYIILSFGLIVNWRLYVFPSFEVRKKENALLVGTGGEMKELEEEVNNNARYEIYFISSIDLDKLDGLDFQEDILNRVYSEGVSVVAADFKNEKVEPVLPNLYNLIFSKVKFIDMYKIYEDIFDRIPLSLVKYSWFLENISGTAQKGYDFVKRFMDLVLAIILAAITLILLPFVALAITIEDRGPIFFSQERVGKNNKIIKVYKFRSLQVHNDGGLAKTPVATKIGAFLRKSRIDELPQVWSVIRGDLSLIGPRPEVPTLVKLYEKKIPYYNVRHLIKPGLSGWAQLYQRTPPKFSAGVDETRTKLSYDLFYIKNRSFMLDLKIALRTIRTLLSREGV